MKLTIKILSVIIAITMLFAIMSFSMSVLAEDVTLIATENIPVIDKTKPYIEVGTVSANAGDSIEVPIYLGNNPGIWGAKFCLKYDTSVLTLTGYTAGTVFAEANILCSPVTNQYFTFTAEGPSLVENVTNSGLLITLKFNVAANAKADKYGIYFTKYSPDNFFNYLDNNVPFTFSNGMVSIAVDGTGTTAAVPTATKYTTPPTIKATTAPRTTPTTTEYPQLDKTKTYLEVGTVSANAGDSIEVPVYLGNNPGIWGAKFCLKYDTNVLTLTGYTAGTVFADADILCSPLTNQYFTFTAEGPKLDANVTGDGVIITLKFKVSEYVISGSYDISFTQYSADCFFNCSNANVPFTFGNGKVSVSGIVGTTIVNYAEAKAIAGLYAQIPGTTASAFESISQYDALVDFVARYMYASLATQKYLDTQYGITEDIYRVLKSLYIEMTPILTDRCDYTTLTNTTMGTTICNSETNAYFYKFTDALRDTTYGNAPDTCVCNDDSSVTIKSGAQARKQNQVFFNPDKKTMESALSIANSSDGNGLLSITVTVDSATNGATGDECSVEVVVSIFAEDDQKFDCSIHTMAYQNAGTTKIYFIDVSDLTADMITGIKVTGQNYANVDPVTGAACGLSNLKMTFSPITVSNYAAPTTNIITIPVNTNDADKIAALFAMIPGTHESDFALVSQYTALQEFVDSYTNANPSTQQYLESAYGITNDMYGALMNLYNTMMPIATDDMTYTTIGEKDNPTDTKAATTIDNAEQAVDGTTVADTTETINDTTVALTTETINDTTVALTTESEDENVPTGTSSPFTVILVAGVAGYVIIKSRKK